MERVASRGVRFATVTLAVGPAYLMAEGATIYIEGRSGKRYGPYVVGTQVETGEDGNLVCLVSRVPSSRREPARDGELMARFVQGGLPSLGKKRR